MASFAAFFAILLDCTVRFFAGLMAQFEQFLLAAGTLAARSEPV
jgi:hypothetical protein